MHSARLSKAWSRLLSSNECYCSAVTGIGEGFSGQPAPPQKSLTRGHGYGFWQTRVWVFDQPQGSFVDHGFLIKIPFQVIFSRFFNGKLHHKITI